MLEGGTLGTRGHTLVVVPHLTEPYGPAKTNSNNEIPLCTLKNFPNRIEHTLQVQCTSNKAELGFVCNLHISLPNYVSIHCINDQKIKVSIT